jgi:hypothetical protein
VSLPSPFFRVRDRVSEHSGAGLLPLQVARLDEVREIATASVIVHSEPIGDLLDVDWTAVQNYSVELVAAFFISRHAIHEPEINPDGAADRLDVARLEESGRHGESLEGILHRRSFFGEKSWSCSRRSDFTFGGIVFGLTKSSRSAARAADEVGTSRNQE